MTQSDPGDAQDRQFFWRTLQYTDRHAKDGSVEPSGAWKRHPSNRVMPLSLFMEGKLPSNGSGTNHAYSLEELTYCMQAGFLPLPVIFVYALNGEHRIIDCGLDHPISFADVAESSRLLYGKHPETIATCASFARSK
nr:hypothetical protein CFP56_54409 [Quercus suber]